MPASFPYGYIFSIGYLPLTNSGKLYKRTVLTLSLSGSISLGNLYIYYYPASNVMFLS